MRLLDLHINGFGKFHGYSLEFAPGVNIIYGRNEAGKSTLHKFLGAMLFGFDQKPGRSGKRALYEALEPWDAPETYSGQLRIVDNAGNIYRIARDFARSPEDLLLTNEAAGESWRGETAAAKLREVLCGLTETAYLNTISIGQLKAATGREMAAEISRYVKNLNTTGSIDLNADAAISYLEAEKARALKEFQPDAVKTYTRTVGRIKNLEAAVNVPENENRIVSCTERRDDVKAKAQKNAARLAEVEAQMEKAAQTLLSANFTGEGSVKDYLAETLQLFEDFSRAGTKAKSGLYRILPYVLLLLAAGAVGAAIYLGSAAPLLIPLLLGAGVLFLLSFFLLGRGAAFRKQARAKESALSARFQQHLGRKEVDAQSLSDFQERMDGYLKLCAARESSREERDQLQKEAMSLGREQTACQEDMEEQQRIAFSVEQKLTELYMLKNQEAELRQLITENEKIKAKTDAMDIAIETLRTLGQSIRSSAGTYLNREAGRIINGITGGAYCSMDIGPSMDIYLNTKTRMTPITAVSSGTMDQVYLALRLAAVRLIEGDNGVLPLIFDDSFVLYDDERLKHALSFTAKDRGSQILLFTCHHREENALKALSVPYQALNLTD